MILVRGKRTADMTKDLCGSPSQCLKMLLYIREQQLERAAVMIMGHDSSRDAPEPFDAVGIRVIGGGIHQIQVLLEFAEQAAHEQRASRSVGLEIIGNHHGHPSALLGTSHSNTHLLTKHISGASGSDPAIEPAIAPVDQTKAVDLAIISRSLDQTLPTSTFATPQAREGWVEGHLHLILQIEVSAWQQREQLWHIGGKLIPQISLDQVMNG